MDAAHHPHMAILHAKGKRKEMLNRSDLRISWKRVAPRNRSERTGDESRQPKIQLLFLQDLVVASALLPTW
jgi:hypothetical protein